jgi:hypothetical protein
MNKLKKTTITALLIIAIISQAVNIFISNTTALNSIEASKIVKEIDAYSETNLELKDKVLSYSAYTTIASRAAALGYTDSKEIVSVYSPVKVAALR